MGLLPQIGKLLERLAKPVLVRTADKLFDRLLGAGFGQDGRLVIRREAWPSFLTALKRGIEDALAGVVR